MQLGESGGKGSTERVETGVFPHLINKAAFLDKVELALWGVRRQRILPAVAVKPSIPIGGHSRPYGRSIHGRCIPTANPFEFRYGRIQAWPRLAPLRLVARSNSIPLTGTQVALIGQSLLRQGYRTQVGLVELTFDTQDFAISYFRRHIFTQARYFRELRDESGRQTFYIGSPHSPWQLRIYQKTEAITRLEYILRLPFLRAHGIRNAEDLLRLRKLNLWNLASFKEFDELRLMSTLNAVPDCWGKDLLMQSPHRWPLQTLSSVLRWRCGIDPMGLLQPSDLQRLLGRMQKNLLW